MRIVAGSLRGRRIVAPKTSATRPTTDRVRESMFSVLTSLAGSDLGGGRVLDAFAGSGALGLEAVSRGAGPVTLVERDQAAVAALKMNVSELGAASAKIIRADVFALARRGIGGEPFALILLDPPYTLDATTVAGLLVELARTGAISEGCHVVWEHSDRATIEWPTGFAAVVHKRYGTTCVDFGVYEGGVQEQ